MTKKGQTHVIIGACPNRKETMERGILVRRKGVMFAVLVMFLMSMLLPVSIGATSVVFRKEFTRPDTSQPDPGDQPSNPGLTPAEQEMVNLVNKERSSRGLRPLQLDMQLVQIARLKSQDMINKNYFSHYSPTYGLYSTMLRNNGVSFRLAGENLAGASSVQQAHNSLMASNDHRVNILKSGYTHFGIGIVNGGPYGGMYTQFFITK